MARITVYRNYRFIDKDPIIDHLRTIKQDEGLKNDAIHSICGIATATLNNWFDGDTRRPQNATISVFSTALGYVRHDRIRGDGSLEIRFEKVRKVDYAKEREQQTEFFLKQNTPGKKRSRKKKTNGHGR